VPLPNSADVTTTFSQEERKDEKEQRPKDNDFEEECAAHSSSSTLLLDDHSSMSVANDRQSPPNPIASSSLNFEIENSSHNQVDLTSTHGYQYLSESHPISRTVQNITLDVALERVPVGKFHQK
jgi:hypothetical protein